MPVKQSTLGKYSLLTVSGDLRGSEEDYRKLRRMGHQCLAERPCLAVNLRQVTYIDSQSLGLFVELLRTAQSRGGETVLVELSERAARWFEMSGLDCIFRILPDQAELAPAAEPATTAPKPNPALERVNVQRMVQELRTALGEADAAGAPSAAGPVNGRELTEIEKLRSGS
jgi:anti-anti-sigma factor